jgi:hypothetical protein
MASRRVALSRTTGRLRPIRDGQGPLLPRSPRPEQQPMVRGRSDDKPEVWTREPRELGVC